jgi:dihydrolipoamide dehydrogenase
MARAAAEADCILNATGRAPVIQGVGSGEAASISVARNPHLGPRQDEHSRHPGPADVTGRRMLATPLRAKDRSPSINMFGIPDRIRYNAIPAVIYTHPEVASAGRTEEAAGRRHRVSKIRGAYGPLPEGSSWRTRTRPEWRKVLTGARYREIP